MAGSKPTDPDTNQKLRTEHKALNEKAVAQKAVEAVVRCGQMQ
jgi:hypothetical protein